MLYSLYPYNEKNNFHTKAGTSPVHDKTEQIGTTNRQRRNTENKTAIFILNINKTNTIATIKSLSHILDKSKWAII